MHTILRANLVNHLCCWMDLHGQLLHYEAERPMHIFIATLLDPKPWITNAKCTAIWLWKQSGEGVWERLLGATRKHGCQYLFAWIDKGLHAFARFKGMSSDFNNLLPIEEAAWFAILTITWNLKTVSCCLGIKSYELIFVRLPSFMQLEMYWVISWSGTWM